MEGFLEHRAKWVGEVAVKVVLGVPGVHFVEQGQHTRLGEHTSIVSLSKIWSPHVHHDAIGRDYALELEAVHAILPVVELPLAYGGPT